MAKHENGSFDIAAWAQVASAVVGVVAAVVAAVIGAQTLEQGDRQREEAKTQRTLEFFATFSSQNMMETRAKLDNENWCARYEYYEPAEGEYAPSVNVAEIVSVIDFFDAVHRSCPPSDGDAAPDANRGWWPLRNDADRGLCDREFAEELLRPYAIELYDELSRAILIGRESGRGEAFGQGIVTMADATGQRQINDVAARYERQCRGLPMEP